MKSQGIPGAEKYGFCGGKRVRKVVQNHWYEIAPVESHLVLLIVADLVVIQARRIQKCADRFTKIHPDLYGPPAQSKKFLIGDKAAGSYSALVEIQSLR